VQKEACKQEMGLWWRMSVRKMTRWWSACNGMLMENERAHDGWCGDDKKSVQWLAWQWKKERMMAGAMMLDATRKGAIITWSTPVDASLM
jgi:hypothetical protein